MQHSSNSVPSTRRGAASVRRVGLIVFGLIVAVWTVPGPRVEAQQRPKRLNRMIEALEAGRQAISGETWAFVEQEHNHYNIVALRATLTTMLLNRNAQGQPVVAPIVQIMGSTFEGENPVKWVIQQVLEAGAMGVVIPHVESAEMAMRFVQSMRFPPQKGSKYPEPRGKRGWGGRGGEAWGLGSAADYVRLADVWPLNPEGELFAMAKVESPEGAKNINAILDVPGISGVLVGPGDLAMNSGEGPGGDPVNKPDTMKWIDTIAKACVAKKKICGITASDEAHEKRWTDMGYRFLLSGFRRGGSVNP